MAVPFYGPAAQAVGNMSKFNPDDVQGPGAPTPRGDEPVVLRPGQVVERVIDRTADKGVVTERVVQTVVMPAASASRVEPVAPAAAAVPAPEVAEAPHAPTTSQDEVYYEGSPMLRGEFGRVMLWGCIGVALILLPFLIGRLLHGGHPAWWRWWLTAAFILAGVVVLIVPLVLTRSVRYRVTNYRINWERGVFSKDIDTLELWHVEDIKFRQNLFQKIMGVGTILVQAHDRQTPNLTLESVPDARRLFETLQQRVIAVKRSGGVMKLDTGT